MTYEKESKNYDDNFASGLWEYQERPPYTLHCDKCDGKTEYVFTWVWKNLSREEEAVIIEQWHMDEGKPSQLCRMVEEKLKEKNTELLS